MLEVLGSKRPTPALHAAVLPAHQFRSTSGDPPRRRHLFVSCALAIAWALCLSPVVAEEILSSNDISESVRVWAYRIEPNGMLSGKPGSMSRRKSELDAMNYLQHETLRRDLGLTAGQWKQIESLHKDYERIQDEQFLRYTQPETLDGDKKRIAEEMREAELKAQAEIDSILTPDQHSRLQQFKDRFDYFLHGPLASLLDGDWSERLKVTAAQKDALLAAAPRLRDSLLKRMIEIQDESFERLLSALDEAQVEQLNKIIGPPLKGRSTNLSMQWESLGGKSAVKGARDEVPISRWYGLDHSGRLSLFDWINPFGRPTESLIYQLTLPAASTDLEYTIDQKNRIRDIYREFDLDRFALFNRNRGRTSTEEEKREFERKLKALEAEAAARAREQVLLPHQVDQLSQFIMRVRIHRLGILPVLTSDCAQELELRPKQQQALMDKAAEVREFLVQEATKLEESMLEDLYSNLTSSQRLKLNAWIGKRPEGVMPGLEVLLFQLSNAKKEKP